MKAIIKRTLLNYLINPIFWFGFIIVAAGIYSNLATYLNLTYADKNSNVYVVEASDYVRETDGEITDGYIPCTNEEQWNIGYQKIEQSLMDNYEYSKKDVNKIIKHLQEQNFTISELKDYMIDQYSYYNADWAILDSASRKGTANEINAYINEQFEQHTYSYYLSRKFADFGGLYMAFFATVLLALLFIGDCKKDCYELLHTKPISSVSYICGKVLGGFISMLIIVGLLDIVFTVFHVVNGLNAGFPINILDILFASIFYIMPNLLAITCVYTLVAILFKNPFPAIPMLFLYIVYSNMGRIGPDGYFGYYGRPLAIMVRFPGSFFETAPPPYVALNQLFLVVLSIVIIVITTYIWKRRRTY